MEIVLLVVVAAIVLTVVYFFPIQQNRYDERLYGRKHIQRSVNATEKALLCPEAHESEEEVIERKEESRTFTDHIIGVSSLSEEDAWGLFRVLFGHLEEVDLGDITLNLLDTNIIKPYKGLEKSVKWAARQRIGNEREAVIKYLAQRLNGNTTRLALEESITADTSWYDLLNNITSSARLHQLGMRRRYEFQGGTLLNWFSTQGRRRAPWHRMSCETCEHWPAD